MKSWLCNLITATSNIKGLVPIGTLTILCYAWQSVRQSGEYYSIVQSDYIHHFPANQTTNQQVYNSWVNVTMIVKISNILDELYV